MMNDISNTALLTLKCHIQDANQDDSILHDRSSLKMYDYLNANLDERGKNIFTSKVRKSVEKHTVIRARKYDDYVNLFLQKHHNAVIVNIGCGLDHRFIRIDNGKCYFLDIDLPEIIYVKKNIFPATKRYRQLAQSVFDHSWMVDLPKRPILLLAEGVFMYCNEEEVKTLFHEIHSNIPGTEMVFEVFSSKWLKGWKKKMVDFKLQRQLKFGKGASYRFGISDSDEIEDWSPNYKLIEDWSYFDVTSPYIRESFRKIQWTVNYIIN